MSQFDKTKDEAKLGSIGKKRIGSDRSAEFLGFVRGVAADSVIADVELERLFSWVTINEEFLHDISLAPVIEAIKVAYHATDDIKEDRKAKLLSVIDQFTGGNLELGELPKTNALCLDNPAPEVKFWGMQFVFTGPVQPSVKTCEQVITALNGIPKPRVSSDIDYLVVAGSAHTAWKHSNGGTKIQKALKLKEDGRPIKIISEEHWRAAVKIQLEEKGMLPPSGQSPQ